MPWNGSGVFARVYSWVADAAAGLDILADRMDQDTDDIAQGLMHCLTVNGETVPTANLPMANYRHTGVSAGVADTDYCTVGQIKNGGGGLAPGGYLPLSGGTMTGRLIMQSSGNPNITLNNTGAGPIWGMWAGGNPATLQFGISNAAGVPQTGLSHFDQAGNLVCAGNVTCGVLTANLNRILVSGGASPGITLVNTVGGGPYAMWNASGSLSWGFADSTGTPTAGLMHLDANGNLTANGNVNAVNGFGTSANLSVGGAATIGGTLTVTGGATLGALTVGNVTINGAATVHGALAALDGINAGNTIFPSLNDTYECGIAAAAWFGVESYAFVQHSDARSKTDLAPLDADCLDLVRRIVPQRFRWAEGRDANLHWGFVAQDVAAAMAAGGHEFGGHLADPESGAERLAYNELVAVLWRAVQQMAQHLDAMSTPAGMPPQPASDHSA